MQKDNKRIYFASPFFNDEQVEREERIKSHLRDLGFDVWSPKENCVCPPNASQELRKSTFEANCENIIKADILFAITDGKDMGTIWEAGYAYGINQARNTLNKKPIIIVYYCETLGNAPFNLMLAQSGDIVITKFDDIKQQMNLLNLLVNGETQYEFTGNIE